MYFNVLFSLFSATILYLILSSSNKRTFLMKEKNNKKKNNCICIDCAKETSDFYKVPTNRGDVAKCANCYELWILRTTRYIQGRSTNADDVSRSSEMNRKSPTIDWQGNE